eukprot:TRINITY_DN4763_c2_g1_i1.p1 TRINITY_DN4763_c2_g1~~TRINITY_DN4763_c2_g1_i1.p1  ORF type:complete len:175 (-),score=34.19 TRINITY_DN4763_c2_g1_i1:700-1224(-)
MGNKAGKKSEDLGGGEAEPVHLSPVSPPTSLLLSIHSRGQGQLVAWQVQSDDTVLAIKQRIAEAEEIKMATLVDEQRLVIADQGTILQHNHLTLAHYVNHQQQTSSNDYALLMVSSALVYLYPVHLDSVQFAENGSAVADQRCRGTVETISGVSPPQQRVSQTSRVYRPRADLS